MEENTPLTSRISTVVPATPRGDETNAFHLGYMDLLMKLHYIRAVYFFPTEAAQGLSIHDFKKPMFSLLDTFPRVSGRIRGSESGRPFIKCNDAGVRIVESHCDDYTLEEWLHQNGHSSVQGLVVHDHVLGPDLAFSPLVFLKFTWFKCGGLCMGLSWSHVLGDAISAFNFITMWSQILTGDVPLKSLHMPNSKEIKFLHNSVSKNPISVKKASITGECWFATNDIEVVNHSFYITYDQLDHLATTTSSCGENQTTKTSYFSILSALVWKYIACIREDFEPKVVTICTYGTDRRDTELNANGSVLSVVEANVAVGKSNVSDLARLIAEEKKVENHIMEKLIEESEGKEDFIVFGANLTFVDLEEVNIYGVNLNGHNPILANCTFHGVGDQGVVLVLPAPEDNKDGSKGRMITVSLPKKELDQLKDKLEREWDIASHPF